MKLELLQLLDILGHGFYFSLGLGMFLLARKKIYGWCFRFVGEVGWVVLGVYLNMSSIVLWGAIFACMDLYGFWSWYTKKNEIQAVVETAKLVKSEKEAIFDQLYGEKEKIQFALRKVVQERDRLSVEVQKLREQKNING